MSVSSNIGYVSKEDGKIHYVYCHFAGYYGQLGVDLFNKFKKYEDVVELIEKGDMSYIDTPYTSLGEEFKKPRIVNTLKSFKEDNYLYIFDKDIWKTLSEDEYVSLRSVI